MPSKRHEDLQYLAGQWIKNRSFKLCGFPEVESVGYAADFVAIAGMYEKYHRRYTKHSGLTMKYLNFGLKRIYQEYGDIDRWYVCVFEVKVSRSDFLNTFGNRDSAHAKERMEPVGTAHWVVAEKGICKPEELPDFWGLLTPYGSGLTEVKMPILNVLPNERIHAIGFDMLWLQMNKRKSYYEQVLDMEESVKNLHRAIMRGATTEELLPLSGKAISVCHGQLFE